MLACSYEYLLIKTLGSSLTSKMLSTATCTLHGVPGHEDHPMAAAAAPTPRDPVRAKARFGDEMARLTLLGAKLSPASIAKALQHPTAADLQRPLQVLAQLASRLDQQEADMATMRARISVLKRTRVERLMAQRVKEEDEEEDEKDDKIVDNSGNSYA